MSRSRCAVALGLAGLLWWGCATSGRAGEATPLAADPALEARVMRVATELRCLVCQNQTIADSHSGLAEDLRREVREQLRRGATEAQVVDFMTDRYGDFVRYRPPLKASTVVLWAGPGVLMAGGLLVLVQVLRRRARLDPGHFDPEEPDDAPGADGDLPCITRARTGGRST